MTQGPAVRSHLTSWNSRIFRENILSLCLLQSTILFNLGVSFLVSFKSNVKCVVHINIVTVKFFEIFNIITADSPQKLYKNPASLCNTYALIFFTSRGHCVHAAPVSGSSACTTMQSFESKYDSKASIYSGNFATAEF